MEQEEKHNKHKEHGVEQRKRIAAIYSKHAGSISGIAKELGLVRSTVRAHIQKMGIKKPIAGGKQRAAEIKEPLPISGSVKRFILTSAQNNTFVHEDFWVNVLAMAKHYEAKILVGTFSYNQNNFGKLSVKNGTKKEHEDELWYDPAITPYISDARRELAPGLTWCGNLNVLPTEDNPISGLETYGGSNSVIFPHAKIEMRSIATMPDMPVKYIYTTGACTLLNYLQKKLGIKAEHHHRYAFLLVEVDSDGNWWVRQVAARKNGKTIQDLNIVVEDGAVHTDGVAEAITWGDLHSTIAQPEVVEASLNMLDTLHPKYQFLHDIMEGASTNRHLQGKVEPYKRFHTWLRGLHRVDEELRQTKEVVEKYLRPWCKTVVPDSNHDRAWIRSWLENYDYRFDPANSELFLRLQNFAYAEIRSGKLPKNINFAEQAFVVEAGMKRGAVKFLLPDEPFVVGEVELGSHGHLGPNGTFGSPSNLSKIGRKATTAHTHSAGIYHGLFVAGTSSRLTEGWDYCAGPSSWSWSHVVQYANGQRTVVTFKNKKWRA